ncbi:hypothetical protein Fmac_018384 [Flemingia macrophylla]|uniref:Uncharacterized protein n=1 Tax=Flemingia macrophylla TaxID=520843 RepID=A0ABD1M4T8_9FABA
MLLHVFFSLALTASPLTLYIPPVRSLNLFVETIEDMKRGSRVWTNRIFSHLREAWPWVMSFVLFSTR